MEQTFKERYIAGKIKFDLIDDYIDAWSVTEDMVTLREYLGLTIEEETAWVEESEEALVALLDAQKL